MPMARYRQAGDGGKCHFGNSPVLRCRPGAARDAGRRIQHVAQLIAGTIEHRFRPALGDQLRHLSQQLEQPHNQLCRAMCRLSVGPHSGSADGQFPYRSVGQHDLQTLDMPRAEPVLQPWLPEASIATTLPIVVTRLIAGSGPNSSAARREMAFNTRGRRRAANAHPVFVHAHILRMYRLNQSPIRGRADSPPVPCRRRALGPGCSFSEHIACRRRRRRLFCGRTIPRGEFRKRSRRWRKAARTGRRRHVAAYQSRAVVLYALPLRVHRPPREESVAVCTLNSRLPLRPVLLEPSFCCRCRSCVSRLNGQCDSKSAVPRYKRYASVTHQCVGHDKGSKTKIRQHRGEKDHERQNRLMKTPRDAACRQARPTAQARTRCGKSFPHEQIDTRADQAPLQPTGFNGLRRDQIAAHMHYTRNRRLSHQQFHPGWFHRTQDRQT